MIKFKSLVIQLIFFGVLLGASQVSFGQATPSCKKLVHGGGGCMVQSQLGSFCPGGSVMKISPQPGTCGNSNASNVNIRCETECTCPAGQTLVGNDCVPNPPPPPPCPEGQTCCAPHLMENADGYCVCPNEGTQVNTGNVCESTCPFGHDDNGMCWPDDCPYGDGTPAQCNDRTCSNEGHKSVEMLPGMWMCVKDIPDDSSSSSSAGGDDDNGNGDGGDGGSNSSTDGGQNNSSTSSASSVSPTSSSSSSSGNGGGGSGSSTSNAGSSASGGAGSSTGAGSSAGNGQGDCPAGQVQQGTVNGNPVCAGQCPSGQSWGSVNDVWGCYGSGSSGSSASSCPAGQECNGDGGTGEWPEPGGFCEEGEECNSLTMEGVLGDFMEGITSAEIISSMDEFLTIDGGGSCPVWNVSAWIFTLTIDQFCSPHIPWGLIRGVILFVASVIAFRIAFT